jgi:hypothetical protein
LPPRFKLAKQILANGETRGGNAMPIRIMRSA